MSQDRERERIEAAIGKWWPRLGSTSVRIVNILLREEATDAEARVVGVKLAEAAGFLNFLTDEIIEQKLEMARAMAGAGKVPVTRGWDGARCNFDYNPCAECGDWDPVPVVHGPLITIGVVQPPTLRSV